LELSVAACDELRGCKCIYKAIQIPIFEDLHLVVALQKV